MFSNMFVLLTHALYAGLLNYYFETITITLNLAKAYYYYYYR